MPGCAWNDLFTSACATAKPVSTVELLASLAILAVAAFAQGVFGMGFAMIATPMLALFLDYRAAVFFVALPLLVLSGSWLFVNRHNLHHPRFPWSLLAGIVVGASTGVWLQVALTERVSLLLLATLLGFSVALPWGLEHLRTDVSVASRRAAPLLGALAGITESALNVGAPFMVLFGGLGRLTRQEQLVALNLCFFFGKAIQVSLMTSAIWLVAPLPLVVGLSVSLLLYRAGDRLAGRYPAAAFRRLLAGFLSLMAVSLLVRAAFHT
ncbi:MAG: sulfite exporter TauE/SafE family protein [Betaproteobacteria bacterium]|nr:sulfite exporter TauE/SafE family protein [Betaproteobacteria bacterium]